jgi:hypothetical protein
MVFGMLPLAPVIYSYPVRDWRPTVALAACTLEEVGAVLLPPLAVADRG